MSANLTLNNGSEVSESIFNKVSSALLQLQITENGAHGPTLQDLVKSCGDAARRDDGSFVFTGTEESRIKLQSYGLLQDCSNNTNVVFLKTGVAESVWACYQSKKINGVTQDWFDSTSAVQYTPSLFSRCTIL